MRIDCFLLLATSSIFVNAQLPLTPGTVTFDMWRKLPVKPVLRVYIYNVTNKDEILGKGHKPSIREIGPYVYQQTWEKVNIKFNKNGTLTYNLKKTFQFAAELSAGSEKDIVVVPNIPLLTVTSKSSGTDKGASLERVAINFITKQTNSQPFVNVTVEQLLWGYEDALLMLSKSINPDDKSIPSAKFGVLVGRKNTYIDTVTVFTGVDDITKIGTVDKFNGQGRLPHWETDHCNAIDGTDGNIFQPNINANTVLRLYDKDLCRALPLKFKKEIKAYNGAKAYRFTPSPYVFANITMNPDNKCFCKAGASCTPHEIAKDITSDCSLIPNKKCFCSSGPICAPHGTFNIGPCQLADAPILLSFPHFYLAGSDLRSAVEGISPPDPKKHEFFIDVHPDTGVPLTVKGRLQINIFVKNVEGVKIVENFTSLVFPILWFEDGIDKLPNDITTMLNIVSRIMPMGRRIMASMLSTSSSMLLTFIRFFF